MDYISIVAIVKDGGYEKLQIPSKFLSELSLLIKKNGSEIVQLKNRSIIVAGILIAGKDMGERIILCGDYKDI